MNPSSTAHDAHRDATTAAINTLQTCAYCPNTCRPSYAAESVTHMESHTPSALSLIALAHLGGQLDAQSGALHVLQRRDAANASRGHCTYGLDIPAALDAALDPAAKVQA